MQLEDKPFWELNLNPITMWKALDLHRESSNHNPEKYQLKKEKRL